MAKRKRRRREPADTETYSSAEHGELTLRKRLSPGTIVKIGEPPASAAASLDDAYQRREEMLFERLVVSWKIADLPLREQAMLLGRYRMASPAERRWVRETITEHLRRHIPELG